MGVTLGDFSFAAATTDSDTIDNKALLSFVAKPSCFIRPGWSRGSVNGVQLTVLPTSHTKEEAQQVRLFFFVQFFKVFVCSHVGTYYIKIKMN